MRYTQASASKINLLLSITGKLPNGYHEIDTVFLPLDTPADVISLDLREDDEILITSSDPIVPCDERNLCWKAADAYARASSIKEGCSIHIEKNIPIAAGMGGGSSNAATVLSILNDHFKLLSDQQLAEIALSIGADVPFFLNPHLSSATGVGEKLIPAAFVYQDIPLVIVAPHFPVSAAWAYRRCTVSENPPSAAQMLNAVQAGDIHQIASLVQNDLAIPLYKKFPVLNILKQQITDAGALCAEVSGSGPTMFGICESKQAAEKCAENLSGTLPESFTVWSC